MQERETIKKGWVNAQGTPVMAWVQEIGSGEAWCDLSFLVLGEDKSLYLVNSFGSDVQAVLEAIDAAEELAGHLISFANACRRIVEEEAKA